MFLVYIHLSGWPLTWKTGKSQGKIFFDGKVREINEKLAVRGKFTCVRKYIRKKIDTVLLISVFCQRIRVISVTF